jgi:hypothetical protein
MIRLTADSGPPSLRVTYSWSPASRPWLARCEEKPETVGRGATPPAALRDLLRRLVGPGDARPTVLEDFVLPAEVVDLQRRFERATIEVVDLESELTVALQRLRLPHSQIAARLKRSPQRLARTIRRRFVDRTP